jgi:single-stranded-DNA-specific exonuclease
MMALKLLLSQDVNEAGELAQILDNQNRERQEKTLLAQMRAEELLQPEIDQALLLFAADPSFNAGLVGLVASRLTEQHYRPSVVVQIGEEFARGSCRSIPEFHITAALDECADLMEHHGGHAAAAGFTVRTENLPELKQRLKEITTSQLASLDLRPRLDIDLELTLSDLKPEILQYLDWMQPTGQGNPQALFVSRGLKVTRFRGVGKENAHLKLTVTDGGITYDAIAFRQGSWIDHMPKTLDLVYTFEVNEFNGNQTLQLNVRDLKPSEG